MKITIVGTGYVGLVSGACFADMGIDVVCVDINQQKLDNLAKGIMPIYEPGLEEIVIRNHAKNRLSFTTDLKQALLGSDVVFIAVGTPPGEDGSADLSHVLSVANAIGSAMDDYMVIATKSTVPVTTGAKVKAAVSQALAKRNQDIPFSVASNPEFLKEGAAVADFMKPDRVVIGTEDTRAATIMTQLYAPFQLPAERLIHMDIPSAEMTKYAANAMLATKISFMNDIANLCERVGANANMVRIGIGSDTRIGPQFIYPGIGYGGSCFPKDIQAIIHTGQQNGYDLRILQAVESVNQDQKHVLVTKVTNHFNGDLRGKHIAIWGLSFKPNTDDIRQSPALTIMDSLLHAGATLSVYDPEAMDATRKHYNDSRIHFSSDALSACTDVDALILVTDWAVFRAPDWAILATKVRHKAVFDGRNMYDRTTVEHAGFFYDGIGT